MKRVTATALILLAVSMVLVWRIISIYRNSPQKNGLRLTIGDTTAFRGSHRNRVEISLENQEVSLRGVQLEMCDGDNYLSCTGCDVADRTRGFTCSSNEKPNGCYELILFSFTKVIEKGKGPIVSFSCDVAEQAPGGECRELSPGRLEIADEKKQSLDAAVEHGRCCFEDCVSPADCDASLWCYEALSCVDGACQSMQRCVDDGLYCNGKEYCDEDANECKHTPEPCAHCYDAGCKCNEGTDSCEEYGGERGDSI